jgi:hypothetical protein
MKTLEEISVQRVATDCILSGAFASMGVVQRPRRNRVTPFGDIEAVPARGTLMGNRGDLHNPDGSIGRTWKLRRWITCTLHSPTGNRVVFDTPGHYAPLFFADEVTALAAGHRPCAECRRPEYDRFRQGWQLAFGVRATAAEMDAVIHQARIDRRGRKVTYQARLPDLPAGVLVTTLDAPGAALLWRDGQLLPWSHAGYGESGNGTDRTVTVLTPKPIVEILRVRHAEQTLAE